MCCVIVVVPPRFNSFVLKSARFAFKCPPSLFLFFCNMLRVFSSVHLRTNWRVVILQHKTSKARTHTSLFPLLLLPLVASTKLCLQTTDILRGFSLSTHPGVQRRKTMAALKNSAWTRRSTALSARKHEETRLHLALWLSNTRDQGYSLRLLLHLGERARIKTTDGEVWGKMQHTGNIFLFCLSSAGPVRRLCFTLRAALFITHTQGTCRQRHQAHNTHPTIHPKPLSLHFCSII